MSWVKREDTAVERVTGLRAQTLGFEQEKEGAASWLFSLWVLYRPTVTYCTYKIIFFKANGSYRSWWAHGGMVVVVVISTFRLRFDSKSWDYTGKSVSGAIKIRRPLVDFLATNGAVESYFEQVPVLLVSVFNAHAHWLTFSFSISYLANLQWLIYIWSHYVSDHFKSDCEESVVMWAKSFYTAGPVIQYSVAWLDGRSLIQTTYSKWWTDEQLQYT